MDDTIILNSAQENILCKLAKKYKSIAKLYHNVLWIDVGLYEYSANNSYDEISKAILFMPDDLKILFSEIKN